MLRCRDGHKAAMPGRDTLGTNLQDTVTHKFTERRTHPSLPEALSRRPK